MKWNDLRHKTQYGHNSEVRIFLVARCKLKLYDTMAPAPAGSNQAQRRQTAGSSRAGAQNEQKVRREGCAHAVRSRQYVLDMSAWCFGVRQPDFFIDFEFVKEYCGNKIRIMFMESRIYGFSNPFEIVDFPVVLSVIQIQDPKFIKLIHTARFCLVVCWLSSNWFFRPLFL